MIYKNITFEEYRKMDGLNCSKLKPYLKSSSHGYWHENNRTFKESQAMNIGTLVHAYVLEGGEKAKAMIDEKFIYDGFPVNEKTGKPFGETSKKYIDWLETIPEGKSVIFPDVLDNTVVSVYRAVGNHKPSVKLLKECVNRETAITWTCERTGVLCKALVDFYGNGKAGDLKTFGREMTLTAIEREMYDRQYHMQFAFYTDGLIANGIPVDEFNVIIASTINEYDVGCFSIDEGTIHQGREDYITSIHNYNMALETKTKSEGQFPDKFEIGIPNWARSEYDDVELLNLNWSE